MLALLVAYITSTLIYTLNLKQPLPSNVAVAISILFLVFLSLFAGGALILHVSNRVARLKDIDLEKACDPTITADTKASVRERPEPAAVPRRGSVTPDEHPPTPQGYHEQHRGNGNGVRELRQPSMPVADARQYPPHYGPRDSVELNLPRQADRRHSDPRHSVPRQTEPQQPVSQHPDALWPNPNTGYSSPSEQARPTTQPRNPSISDPLLQLPQPSYRRGHDARYTLPSITVTAPTPPFQGRSRRGSDYTFSQGPSSPLSRSQHVPINPPNRHSYSPQPDPSGQPRTTQGSPGLLRPRGPRALPTPVRPGPGNPDPRALLDPHIHVAQLDDARDAALAAVLLHLLAGDKDGGNGRLRSVLMGEVDGKERGGSFGEKKEAAMSGGTKSETGEREQEEEKEGGGGGGGGGAGIAKDRGAEEQKLQSTDDKPRLPEKKTKPKTRTRTLRQDDGANKSRRAGTGIHPKLRLVDLPARPNRVFVEDDDLSPKTKGEPDWVTLLKSGEWEQADHSKREGRVFEGNGAGRAEAGGRQGEMGWREEGEGEDVRRGEDPSDESDYDEWVGKKE